MLYTWKDKKTKTVVEVERKMKESDIPPDKPEAIAAGLSVQEFAEAEWEKVITGGSFTKTWGGKGSW